MRRLISLAVLPVFLLASCDAGTSASSEPATKTLSPATTPSVAVAEPSGQVSPSTAPDATSSEAPSSAVKPVTKTEAKASAAKVVKKAKPAPKAKPKVAKKAKPKAKAKVVKKAKPAPKAKAKVTKKAKPKPKPKPKVTKKAKPKPKPKPKPTTAKPKPKPKPTTAKPKPKPTTGGARSCSVTVEGVKVTVGAKNYSATVAKTRGTRATVTMVKRSRLDTCSFSTVFRDTSGRIGYGGAVPASKRRQDTGATPQGTFSVTEAFGLLRNPGTKLHYRVPDNDSYWVLDNNSKHYNQWRQGSAGGFRKGESERLRDYKTQYAYSAVINYNRWPAVKGKGGAIFLHVHGRGATAGCVSITKANMQKFLTSVAKGDTITIR